MAKNPPQAIKGRGAIGAPPGRFDVLQRESADDGWDAAEEDTPARLETVIHFDKTKSILTTNNSPDIPHSLSANPYRGCEHGCIYCFARPTHSYLGLSPGLDFETQIYAKPDAPALLRRELAAMAKRKTARQPLALGIITDAYQPVERRLKITRRMLQILADCRYPTTLVTKSALIERDIDILSEMAAQQLAEVAISITSLDNAITRQLEPRAAAPGRRLKIIERLAAAKIPVTVLMAPIIPAITDREIETLLSQAAAAGASGAGYVILRLPHELTTVFYDWLHTHFPQRADKVIAQIRALHGGKDYRSDSHIRQRGTGVLADLIRLRFARAKRKHGLDRRLGQSLRTDLFRPPNLDNQLSLL